jgi:hypothetical protein
MKEDAIGLWDGALLEVLPDLHVAVGAPGGAGLVEAGMQEGDDQQARALQRGHALPQGGDRIFGGLGLLPPHGGCAG